MELKSKREAHGVKFYLYPRLLSGSSFMKKTKACDQSPNIDPSETSNSYEETCKKGVLLQFHYIMIIQEIYVSLRYFIGF
jgi:hypothetical protein